MKNYNAPIEDTSIELKINYIKKIPLEQSDIAYELNAQTLSIGGITGSVSKNITLGDTFTLLLNDASLHLELSCKVVAVETTHQSYSHKVTCEFLSLTKSQRDDLLTLITHHKEKTLSTSLPKALGGKSTKHLDKKDWVIRMGLFSILIDIVILTFLLKAMPEGTYFLTHYAGEAQPQFWNLNDLYYGLYASCINIILLCIGLIINTKRRAFTKDHWGRLLFMNLVFSILTLSFCALKLI